MGFIGKLFASLSSAALIFFGTANANTSTSPSGAEQEQQLQRVLGGAGELLAGFIADAGGRYTEDAVEAAVRRMFAGMSPDRFTDLPEFVRGLRSLGLSPEVEVAVVETLISMIEEQSGLLIPAEQAAAVTGQIFDVFVEPIMLAQAPSPPRGKFVDEFPGNDNAHERAKQGMGQPFQAS